MHKHTCSPQEEQALIVREEQALLERLHAVLLAMDEADNQVRVLKYGELTRH